MHKEHGWVVARAYVLPLPLSFTTVQHSTYVSGTVSCHVLTGTGYAVSDRKAKERPNRLTVWRCDASTVKRFPDLNTHNTATELSLFTLAGRVHKRQMFQSRTATSTNDGSTIRYQGEYRTLDSYTLCILYVNDMKRQELLLLQPDSSPTNQLPATMHTSTNYKTPHIFVPQLQTLLNGALSPKTMFRLLHKTIHTAQHSSMSTN